MILETFVVVNSTLFVTRAINTKIEQKMREKILSDGLYHVTTEENAEKIMESGHVRPSNNLLSLGRKKCFFFAGTPSYKDLASNCASEASKYEFKAVKLMPNNEELSKFRQRSFNDDSITFRGKCELPEERTKIVDMVLDIDDKGNIYTREKTEEELEKYVPKAELVQKMQTLGNNNVIGIMSKSYIREYKTVGQKIIKKLSDIKNRLANREVQKLPQGSIGSSNYIDNDSNMIEGLKDNIYTVQESYINDNVKINQEERNISVENKELV